MPAIYLQTLPTPEERASLVKEFPYFACLSAQQAQCDWDEVEIFYGDHLSEEEFSQATHLRWIHCTGSDADGICTEAVQDRGNILLTVSKGQNVPQMAEYAIGAMLAFAKELFNIPNKERLWTLQNKILLQIGMGEVGSAIVKLASQFGMKCWGVRRQRSFHPFCQKTFSISHLHSILPAADVSILALSSRGSRDRVLKKEEFELMKQGSIVIVLGAGDSMVMQDLEEVAQTGKFRGILLDLPQQHFPSAASPLWKMPNVLITPSLAPYPESKEHVAFKLFRKNLRLFVLGKIREMKNLILS